MIMETAISRVSGFQTYDVCFIALPDRPQTINDDVHTCTVTYVDHMSIDHRISLEL